MVVQKKSPYYRYILWSALVVLLVVVAFFIFKPAFFFSPPTLTEIMNARNPLTSSFTTLQDQFAEKKSDYQKCISKLSEMIADQYEGDDFAQEFSDKQKECQDIYDDIVLTIGSTASPSDPCVSIYFGLSNLQDQLTELMVDLQVQLNSDPDNTILRAEYTTTTQFRNDIYAETKAVIAFCGKVSALRDPCTAAGGNVDGQASGSWWNLFGFDAPGEEMSSEDETSDESEITPENEEETEEENEESL